MQEFIVEGYGPWPELTDREKKDYWVGVKFEAHRFAVFIDVPVILMLFAYASIFNRSLLLKVGDNIWLFFIGFVLIHYLSYKIFLPLRVQKAKRRNELSELNWHNNEKKSNSRN